MENILISFKTDTAALDEISQKLAVLKQNMAGVVTGGTMQANPQSAKPSGNDLQKQRLDETRKVTAQLILDYNALGKKYDELSQKFNSMQASMNNSVKDSKKSIDELAKAQKNVNAAIGEKAATESLKSQLKKIREEMIALDAAGQTDSARFRELTKRAGELKDRVGDINATIKNAASDTRTFDAIAGSIQLATGSFTTFEGVLSMFGDSGDELSKTMAKMQQGLAITVGAQQMLNAVQEDGAIISGVLRVRTLAETAAKSMSTKGTIAATIAQRVFNTVAKANPYVLLAMALISVVGALYMFSKRTDESAEKQKKANELDEARIDALERVSQVYKDAGDKREKALNNELELLKVSGASQAEISKKESQLLAEKMANASEQYNLHKKEIDQLEQNHQKVIQLTAAVKQMNKAKQDGEKNVVFSINGEMRKVKVSDEAIESLQKELDNAETTYKIAFDYKEGFEKADLEKKKHDAQLKVDAKKQAKDEATAAAEVRLIEAKKGSAEELAARIGAITAQRRADLDNVNLTASQRKLLMVKADKEIRDARNEYLIKNLEDEKSNINAKLLLSKEGSKEELNYRIQFLEKQKEIDLADVNISKAKRLEVEANFLKEKKRLTKEFNDKQTQESISNEINYINASLSYAKQGSQEEYNLKLELIEKQRALEEKQIAASLDNEETKLSKITALNAKAQKDIADMTYEKQKSALDKNLAQQNLALSQDYKKGIISKAEYEAKKEQLTVNYLKSDIELKKGNNQETIELEQQLLDIEAKQREDAMSLAKDLVQQYIGNITDIFNAIQEQQSLDIQQQKQYIQDHYTTDVEEAKKNKQLKLISQMDYDRRMGELDAKQKKQEKAAKRFSILSSSAESIARITFTALEMQAKAMANPFLLPLIPFIWAQIPLVMASTAIQLATVNKYWKGRKSGKGEMAMVGEQGPEMMWVPNGASIIPAHKSSKLNEAFGIMKEYNIPAMFPNIPQLPFINKKSIDDLKDNNSGINYDLLADKIGERMGDQMEKRLKFPKTVQRPVSINVDQTGTTVTDGNTMTHYRNRKYMGVY